MFRIRTALLLAAATYFCLGAACAYGSFGFQSFDVSFTEAPPPNSPPETLGAPDTRPGSHPYQMNLAFALNHRFNQLGGQELSDGKEVRNLDINLPPGMVGDPSAVPQCTRQQLDAEFFGCPASAQIGLITAGLAVGGSNLTEFTFPLYNMAPPANTPAEFAFSFSGIHGIIDAAVRPGNRQYGVTLHVYNITQREIVLSHAAIWGVPADPSHDALRQGENCHEGCSVHAPLKPFLTLPSACSGPLKFSLHADTWQDANITADAEAQAPALTGCERLGFAPSISALPDTSAALTPAGLAVDVRAPQGGQGGESQAMSNIQNASVILPAGLVVNPARATGLTACQPAQANLEGEGPVSCPSTSRIGTVRVSTPLLPEDLEGGVFVLQSNPPDVQLLLAPAAEGVNLKLVGDARMDEATGQLTTTFLGAPDLPFTDLRLSLDGGPRAALVTPGACGEYETNADFTPWASPFLPDALSSSAFTIESGPDGAGCGSPPFAPSLVAGTVNNQAGGFSPFSVTFSRQDQDQGLAGVSVRTPPGLLGVLKNVERCPEPQASQGACGQGSLIGHTTVAAGAGPDPFYVQGGQVFLTGPYKGAPFGLSVVVPTIAGPFNLGNVVVRAAIRVDPHTAQITVLSDPLPSILRGVPLDLRTVNVTIDRQEFMFNPTNCEPLSVDGTLTSTQGASAIVSSRFQAANCATLGFRPSFSVSTQARTSKKSGASLDVKVGYPRGTEANIRSVAVTLPKQLPARLTTIQQACPAATFAADPASCPTGSVIGMGTAKTPILAAPLRGPAYLVSHGGAAFPDVVVVLQGEGITLDLVGSVEIKKSITSSTFASVPDAPISSFELSLPEGSHSGLAAVVPAKARGSLCGQSLAMPTTITAQNGAQIKQSTKIKISGCAKPTRRAHGKKQTKAEKKHPKKGRKQ